MVASKGRGAGGIRILDEFRALKDDVKKHGSESGKAGSSASAAKFSRKSGVHNASFRPFLQTNQIDEGKVHGRRKALADIGNINNQRSQQFASRVNKGSKLTCTMETFGGSKKVNLNGSNCLSKRKISIARNSNVRRLSITKSIVISDVTSTKNENPKSSAHVTAKHKLPVRRTTLPTTEVSKENQVNCSNYASDIRTHAGKLLQSGFLVETRKVIKTSVTTRNPAMVSSKLQRASLGTQNIDIKKLTIAKFSEIKDLKKPGRSNRHDNTFISQELCCDCHSNNSSDEVVKKTISSKKNTRRKSYTSSLLIRNCDDFVKNDMLPCTDDFRNPLEVVEYVEEIYRYYWTMEAGRPHLANYMEMQSEISPKMRDILVNWLIEVHHKYQLMEESLFLMVELLDRLLSVVNVQKKELQLYGLTCLLLASKYEDHWHPKVVELLSLSVDQYTRNEMLAMEWFVLKKLQFHLNVPTPYVFMLRFLKAAEPDKKLEDLAFYLVELCIGENEYLKYKPSLFCASAIFVARCSLKLIPFWTGLLSKLTHYEESQLRTPAEMILRFHKAASCKPIKYTYQKFLKSDRNCVASIKPISRLPP